VNKRIGKLVALKQSVVDGAARSLHAAEARTAIAEKALETTEATLAAALERAMQASTVADLVDADAHATSLRKAIERARAVVRSRKEEEAREMRALTEARTELRRFELWGERALANENAAAVRVARSAEDDLAARKRREA
jgi:hypothetical protein